MDIICVETGIPHPDSLIREVSDEATYEKYLNFSVENYLKASQLVVRCPAPDCTWAFILEEDSTCAHKCAKCDVMICLKCREIKTETCACDHKTDIDKWLETTKA